MIYVGDLMSLSLLDDMFNQEYIVLRTHSMLPLGIMNYTAKAAYEQKWNEVTEQCRGLIFNTITREVIARPFRKFFNYGEPSADKLRFNLSEPVTVTDKLDGSLGILYLEGADGLAIATRGSFESEQALRATKILRKRYSKFEPQPDVTYLFEIIYPENRIVVDYGSKEDLYLLAVLDTTLGSPVQVDNWKGPTRDEFEYKTLADAVNAQPRENAEGMVVYFPKRDVRVKIKQEDYVRIHRVLSGLTARTVWAAIRDNEFDELLETVPDEFNDWVRDIAQDLQAKSDKIVDHCYEEFGKICGDLPEKFERKDFAEQARKSEYSWQLFSIYDDQDITKGVWRNLRPDALTPAGTVADEEYDAA